ncbi:MAG: protein translocase subunit SecD [Actinomycetota bacterium]
MPTSQKVSALAVVVVAVLGILFTVLAGNQPLLGLDLQGGVSVVLEPTGSADGQDGQGAGREVTDEALDLTVELLRGRIDQIGVAEPEISRQGDNIVVALPGLVEDQEEALDRLRQTAELRFRPVLLVLGPALDPNAAPADADADADADGVEDEGTVSESPITTEAPADSGDGDDEADTDGGAGDDEESLAGGGRFGPVFAAQSTTTTAGDAAADDATTTDATSDDATTDDPATGDGTEGDGTDTGDVPLADPADLGVLTNCLTGEITPDTEDVIDEVVVLEDRDGIRYCLGPAELDGQLLTGDMVESADVGLGAGIGWQVNPTLRPGPDGIDKFNAVAAVCFLGSPDTCPTRQLAVVLDHEVISAPVIQVGRFSRDQITISGDFEEEEARRLAEALRFGSLPLELVAQETRTVSASIGQDVLRSGVIAGLIGLVLVAVYLLAYYRLAGLVAISGLVLSAALLWTIVAFFGATFGLALTLAGVVGLIVAIGVSADSNIVYFENVKESYRSGRRVPTAIERAYESAISTIVKADVVSLIAAVLLYLLTVGAVRGFAFYLGLATILDLIISWFFMRPALGWLARRQAVEENPRLLGLPPTQGSANKAGRLAGVATGGES